jgi:hypothetical protein
MHVELPSAYVQENKMMTPAHTSLQSSFFRQHVLLGVGLSAVQSLNVLQAVSKHHSVV